MACIWALGRCIPVAEKAFNTNISVKYSPMPPIIARRGHSSLWESIPGSLSAKVGLLGVVLCERLRVDYIKRLQCVGGVWGEDH
jgi:hypothetical protein